MTVSIPAVPRTLSSTRRFPLRDRQSDAGLGSGRSGPIVSIVTLGPASSRALPVDAKALAEVLPDVPRWLYVRSLLLSGAAEVRLSARTDAALVQDPTTALIVGRPDPELVREGVAQSPPGLVLLVHHEDLRTVRAALPGWIARPFVVHTLPRPYPQDTGPRPGIVVSAPLDPAVLSGLPDDVRADAADAPAAAIRFVDGVPVAVCAVSDLTETLWDVGIDTVEWARRQGYATAVFRALAGAMAADGRQPVWAAYEDDGPSLAMACRLGFRPVARMAELTRPNGGNS